MEKYYGLEIIKYEGREYAVANSYKEVYIACVKYINEHIGFFSANFLSKYTEGVSSNDIEVLQKSIISEEVLNKILKTLIGNKWSRLIDETLKLDGEGHLLASYDGEMLNSLGNLSGKYFFRIN